MAGRLADAKKSLENGETEQALSLASEALNAMEVGGEAEGLATAVRTLVAAQASAVQLGAAARSIDSLQDRFRNEANNSAQAHALVAAAELQLAYLNADQALEMARKVDSLGDFGSSMSVQVLSIQARAHIMKEASGQAAQTARQLQRDAQRSGDQEQVALASNILAGALLLGDTASEATKAAELALRAFREIGGKREGEATALVTLAKASLKNQESRDSLTHAEEALGLWRSLGQSKGLVSVLEVMLQAHAMQDNVMAGLRAVHAELETARQTGNQQLQLDLLDMLTHTHAVLREPVSALSYGRMALDLYWALGDLGGQGWTLHTMGEMQRMQGEMGPATTTAQLALSTFKKIGNRQGVERATETLSSLYAERGLPEKAPKRSEAMKALRALSDAIQEKNEEATKTAEEQLNAVRHLIKDEEIAGALYPLLQRDETAEFLEGLGWETGRDKPVVGEIKKGNRLYHYSKDVFYLQNVLFGMNFGPQFRAVHPWRRGIGQDGLNYTALSSTQLPETEAWQQELAFRPGILDAGLQVGGLVNHFPPY